MMYGQHRRRRGIGAWLARRSPRRPLLGLGITGAGLAAVLVVVLAVVVGIGQASGTPACAAVLSGTRLAGGTVSGTATHYVLQGLPNCSYPSPPADQLFVALSPAEYAGAAGCGGYLEVTGPDGSVLVKVIDQCPECATGHIDLSETAFAKLAPLSAGLINVHYTYLVDPALPGPISIEVKDGSSQYWLALLADDTGNPLSSVQVRTSSGWQSLQRADYNYWIAQSGAGPGPFTVRLTWMYGAGSAPAPSSPVPSAATSSAPQTTAASAPQTTAAPWPSPSTRPSPGTAAMTSAAALVSRSPSVSASPSARRGGQRATPGQRVSASPCTQRLSPARVSPPGRDAVRGRRSAWRGVRGARPGPGW